MVTYIDTSAWVKRYIPEAGADQVDALFDENATFACATLGLIEALAALSRLERAGVVDDRAHRTLRERISADFGRFIAIDFSSEVFSTARLMTERYALHAGDIVHLASADVLRRSVSGPVRFVTADRDLGAAARLARFDVFDPAQG